jgi:hypothetical protein
MSNQTLYKIIFASQGQVYEVYAREVSHGALFGFVEVEELVFGERTSVVVDPSEERIKSEFENVKRTYLPMHSIIRIDEVEKQGTSKITKAEGNVTQRHTVPDADLHPHRFQINRQAPVAVRRTGHLSPSWLTALRAAALYFGRQTPRRD